ncbi:hypothetical protein [Stenotrophomonas oahuensis]|uniref:Uncharacterized protein n=1 Tax=Stenotrophomonas oahuensis TaxID=3003271 RepID=A0ABY9YME6_9GAMM|nr:hypothetical protein [Stenotrophomonas sp. A5586]WNH51892.1 hypothetical protein PDM29_16330 [Stenotrophomonas sp. A5586]
MERPVRNLLRTLTLLVLISTLPSPAAATGDLFRFHASQGEFSFSLEMAGRMDPGSVQISSSDFKPFMPRQPYYVEFNRAQQRAYVRPRTRGELPWFEMDVIGTRGVLHYNGRRMEGTAEWGPW